MTNFNPEIHHRRSVRLKRYDYSKPGWYFITICTYKKDRIFGEIVNNRILLNDIGRLVKDEWIRTTQIRKNVSLDEFVIMPNHMHGIIVINETTGTVGAHCNVPLQNRDVSRTHCSDAGEHPNIIGAHCNVPLQQTEFQYEQFGKSTKNSIPTIIKLFKSATTRHINEYRRTPGVPVWQRNYYEHIIRDENELNTIRKYIIENPLNWLTDEENR